MERTITLSLKLTPFDSIVNSISFTNIGNTF